MFFTILFLLIAKATKGKLSPPPPVDNREILQAPEPHSPIRQMKMELQDQENARLERFGKVLAGPTTDLGKGLIDLRIPKA